MKPSKAFALDSLSEDQSLAWPMEHSSFHDGSILDERYSRNALGCGNLLPLASFHPISEKESHAIQEIRKNLGLYDSNTEPGNENFSRPWETDQIDSKEFVAFDKISHYSDLEFSNSFVQAQQVLMKMYTHPLFRPVCEQMRNLHLAVANPNNFCVNEEDQVYISENEEFRRCAPSNDSMTSMLQDVGKWAEGHRLEMRLFDEIVLRFIFSFRTLRSAHASQLDQSEEMTLSSKESYSSSDSECHAINVSGSRSGLGKRKRVTAPFLLDELL